MSPLISPRPPRYPQGMFCSVGRQNPWFQQPVEQTTITAIYPSNLHLSQSSHRRKTTHTPLSVKLHKKYSLSTVTVAPSEHNTNLLSLRLSSYITHICTYSAFEYIAFWKWKNLLQQCITKNSSPYFNYFCWLVMLPTLIPGNTWRAKLIAL